VAIIDHVGMTSGLIRRSSTFCLCHSRAMATQTQSQHPIFFGPFDVTPQVRAFLCSL
jgi:hypothetical protein